ncbi:ABC transporter ATP-binding protein [Paenibacillus endoradicis]|uniref:ABC transporter ATP-binding protein n=1 Tax=Paenibacillus endoradicis TaxID=2972487 RepID=UPI002158FCE6|nr:ABC transporter ATP-binding protein [Paenibacillus endoradicis]MCR8659819.1 ABC transporter ATP-binding protein [Paenibacillus endoradicis]
MEREVVIRANNLGKIYKLYKKPEDRIKEAFSVFGTKEYYKPHHALKNVSLEVLRGETIGIIGKNGSGKSTFLKMLANVLVPTNGTVEINGRVTSLLELGAGFNPEYTGIENIYLNGTIMGYSKEQMQDKLDTILNFADIGDYVHQAVKTYSSGMFARLAFSVMVNLDPDILIVDEALSVGDIFFQQKCNMYMKNEMKNTTKLLVTHDMNSIANLADRCIVLDKGRVVFEGPPLESIEYYVKSLHSESFGQPTADNDKISNLINKEDKRNLENWNSVDVDKLGGALEARIKRFLIDVNGESYKGFIQENDEVRVQFLLETDRDISDGIFGYIISDKFGNNIFGENSVTSGFSNQYLRNEHVVTMQFMWPEIKEGEYFLTLGIGEGEHELQHIIQCWAHNIFKFDCITPKKTIHCLFNNKILNLTISK